MSGECCSLVVLCLGAMSTLSAIAFVTIGTTTDHWTITTVNRSRVEEQREANNTGYMYFTRHRGLFRTCFPEDERPTEGSPGLFLSALEDWCYSREYHLKHLYVGELRPPRISDQANTHLQLMRITPILLFTYLFSMLLVGLLGLCGCWQQSANKLISTAAFQLLAALIGAAAMATWHAALFFEMEKVHDEGFPLSWPVWLQESTTVQTSWSYILTWIGICLTLIASLTTSAAAICLRSRTRDWEDSSMRMKLKMSRMFAQHAYFPDEVRSSSRHLRPRSHESSRDIRVGRSSPSFSSREYPTIPANFPTRLKGFQGTDDFDEQRNINSEDRMYDYRRTASHLEDSRF